ncbi:MAG: hypothetical protein WCW53_13720 [Syntrophales bacterium]|jgi:hypothetical protein
MKEIVADSFLKVGLIEPEGLFADITLTGVGYPGNKADKKSNDQKRQNIFKIFHHLQKAWRKFVPSLP